MTNKIVVIAEHADSQVNPVTYELIAFAKKLPQAASWAIQVLILGAEIQNLAHKIADESGLDVMGFEVPGMPVYNGELYNKVLADHLVEVRPLYVCIAHTSQGSDFAPALAIELNGACISGIEDVLSFEEGVCLARPVYGGKVTAHIRPLAATSILTIQPGFFKSDNQSDQESGSVTIRKVPIEPRRWRSMGIKQIAMDTAGVKEADVVVAAGQGIGDRDNLDLINQLASIFAKSAVAGSRIVCDLGWLAYGRQVGVTGATVSPQLYIACGISGAIQHVTGMRGAEFIVAINKDPAAAIFQVADICVVEDLTTFIPILIETYQKTKDSR
ncbi:Electron transfer flavoprotein, alpha subunit [Olavius sp. associated proteobacterium Delta 1]|nr:Electron transfer flavoprotein, alpha subunit [Olavius sp. associated proteobacterium Delta 1]